LSGIDVHFNQGTLELPLGAKHVVRPVTGASPVQSEGCRYDPAPIVERVAGTERLLVVINDSYRPTPTRGLLEPLRGSLRRAGGVRIVVATGKHPGPGSAALRRAAGDVIDEFPVYVHDASEPGVEFGPLANGAPLELNRQVEWADSILLAGSVEPHFFAGFTGGAKQLLPGLARAETIEANHRHAVHTHCRPCRVADNPVAAPIRETAAMFADRLLSVQAVAGPEGWEVFCGTEHEVFQRSTARCEETATIDWPEPLDLLIAVIHAPLDRNLYQLQKGFENHQWAVKDGGRLLLVSACGDGIGNEFFEDLATRYPDWRNLPPWEAQTYSLGLHKLYRTAKARERIGLYLYSALPGRLVRKFYLEPVADLKAWLTEVIGSGARVGIIEDAAGTVSRIGSKQSKQ